MPDKSKLNNLAQAIVSTVAYFDIFDYPLTTVEIWKWLYLPDQADGGRVSLGVVINALDQEELKKIIDFHYGFYFLAGRQSIIRQRMDKYRISEIKFKIALKVTFYLRRLSLVKMISVCNNVGYNNGSGKSDIDFFIVVKHGRLWISRLLITLVTTILGSRRHDKKIINRVCLSFYIGSNSLDLSAIALPSRDIYLAYWLATLAPIYGAEYAYNNFLQANSWVKTYLPNFYPVFLTSRRKVADKIISNSPKSLAESAWGNFIMNFLDRLAKVIQRGRIKRYFGDKINQDNTNVIISDLMLKFHKVDRRAEYQDVWRQKILKILS